MVQEIVSLQLGQVSVGYLVPPSTPSDTVLPLEAAVRLDPNPVNFSTTQAVFFYVIHYHKCVS